MKIILMLFLLFSESKCADPKTSYVYVCVSHNAKRYHLKADCRGLSNCTYQIVKTTVADAKKSGKTLCHLEK